MHSVVQCLDGHEDEGRALAPRSLWPSCETFTNHIGGAVVIVYRRGAFGKCAWPTFGAGPGGPSTDAPVPGVGSRRPGFPVPFAVKVEASSRRMWPASTRPGRLPNAAERRPPRIQLELERDPRPCARGDPLERHTRAAWPRSSWASFRQTRPKGRPPQLPPSRSQFVSISPPILACSRASSQASGEAGLPSGQKLSHCGLATRESDSSIQRCSTRILGQSSARQRVEPRKHTIPTFPHNIRCSESCFPFSHSRIYICRQREAAANRRNAHRPTL